MQARGVFLVVTLLVFGQAGLLSAAAAEDVTLHRSDETGVRFTVRFPGPQVLPLEEPDANFVGIQCGTCVWIEDPGRPQVPVRRVLVGIPFGVVPSLRVLAVEEGGAFGGIRLGPVPAREGLRDEEGFGRIGHEYRPDPSIYGRNRPFPDLHAEIGSISRFRHERVLEALVYPLQWNPVTGRVAWASAVAVEVTWTPGGEEKRGVTPPPEPAWDALCSRVVVNPDAARGWRSMPAPAFKGSAPRPSEMKFVVPETGVYRLDYEDLEGTGGPVALEDLSVYRKVYAAEGEVPYREVPAPLRVFDEGGDGFFGPGDRAYFWALDFRDAYMALDFEDRYTNESVYWVGWGAGGNAPMDSVVPWSGAAGDTLRSFPEKLRFEDDRHFWLTPTVVDRDSLPPASDVDWYYWTSKQASGGTVAFEIHDAVEDSIPRLRVRFQGYARGTHTVQPILINSVPEYLQLAPQDIPGFEEYFFDTADSIPPGFLAEGTNYFQFGGKGDDKSAFGAFLDWIEVRYARTLVAREDYLRFETGALPECIVPVDGFSTGEVFLMDVTDVDHPAWVVLGEEQVQASGGTFRLVLPESTETRTSYAAFTAESAHRVSNAELRATDDPCWEREGDYLLLTHEDFAEELRPLADYRASQGYRVQVVPVGEIYDAFGGGHKNPLAIRRYLQWGYAHWSVKPLFVVLGGDGSDDHRGVNPDSGPDFVPSVNEMWIEEPIPLDAWYANLDDDDDLPDLYVGRLPAGSTAEMESLVEKILAYEAFGPDDAWRRRILAVSDDQCSTVDEVYRCQAPQEELFEDACRYALAQAAASPGATLDTLGLHMSEYTGYTQTSGWHVQCFAPDVTDRLGCMRTVVRNQLTPVLFGILNEGVLLFQFQGHGHRKVMSHEYIVDDGQYFDGAYRYDFRDRLSNAGRPFLLATFGCHFADFSEAAENSINNQESIVEKAVLQPEGGAIAGLGPVGYEEYRVARVFQKMLADVFFESPPEDPSGQPGARWLLGEIATAAMIRSGLENASGRTVLLGDPALRMDASPPAIRVTADGVPIADGDYISAGPGTDLVHLRAVLGDEVAVDSSTVRLSVRQGEEVTWLQPGVDFVLSVVDTVSGSRVITVDYTHRIVLAEYSILFEAADGAGRRREFTARVGASAELYSGHERVHAGAYVVPGEGLELALRLPKASRASDLGVKLARGAEEWFPDVTAEAQSPDSTEWRLAFEVSDPEDGAYVVYLVLEGAELEVVRFLMEGNLEILNLTSYPNPFERETDFLFQLTRPAAVEIRVFTVSGKRVATLLEQGGVGYNRIRWDGRDGDGDPVANGVYLYRARAKGMGEEAESETQKAVRIR